LILPLTVIQSFTQVTLAKYIWAEVLHSPSRHGK